MKITINLLPLKNKEEIRIQQFAGMVFKIGFSAVFAVVVFVIFLFSCLFIIDLQEKIVAEETSQLEKVNVYGEVRKTHDLVDEYYKNTEQLEKALSDQISHVLILEKINDLIPDNLFLEQISIVDGKIIIKGFSSNRESLIEFRDKLEKSDLFDSVEAPISNFTASENINFTFTIGIKK